MKKLAKFKLIGRLINNRTNMAAKDLADFTNEYNKKQKKLTELQHLVQDYKDKLSAPNLEMAADHFKHSHRFIQYLEYVIKQQTEVVALYKRELDKKRQIWIYCHKQNKGLKGYISQVESELLIANEKKEQKDLDYTVTEIFVGKKATDN